MNEKKQIDEMRKYKIVMTMADGQCCIKVKSYPFFSDMVCDILSSIPEDAVFIRVLTKKDAGGVEMMMTVFDIYPQALNLGGRIK